MAEEKKPKKAVKKQPKRVVKKKEEVVVEAREKIVSKITKERREKIILKITKERKEFFIRGKEMLYYEHYPMILTDNVLYTVHTPYGNLEGSCTWIFLATELRLPIESIREFVDSAWSAITDVVVADVVTSSELDKIVLPEVKETKIVDISEVYVSMIRTYLLKSLGR